MTDRTNKRLSRIPLVSPTRSSAWRRRAGLLSSAFLAGGAALGASGCLQRPVVEQEPVTSNVFVTQVPFSKIDAIDLLFVVDNSVSMADKQVLLVQAVPQMVERLVTPDCVNSATGERQASARNDAGALQCSGGENFALEFDPVNNIHIGVISSSIGGFGSPQCTMGTSIDKSKLIPKVRADVPDPTGQGFLHWAGGVDAQVAELSADFSQHVAAVGEDGCGFEAPLEAWYRFLVDPSPPIDVVKGAGNVAATTGTDTAILAQRAEFLRPTSLVAIVVLTDENDCSAMEGGPYYENAGFGWLVPDIGRAFETASTQCEANPNDVCCYSCLVDGPPAGCEETCTRNSEGNGAKLPPELDRANARCFQNKRRFGLDLLYPTSRYVDGLSKSTIVDSQTGQQAANPLLLGADLDPALRLTRLPNLVFFAGIVGVPWQDIATEATREDPASLAYMDARQLDADNRWAVILGDPGLPYNARECAVAEPPDACSRAPIPPSDPFMIESINPRTGVNPITGENIVPLGGSGWSDINGHEYDNSVNAIDGKPSNDDLQYSCIFPLAADAVKENCMATDATCDCGEEPTVAKGRPLCKPQGSTAATAATASQYWGKAYPATRVLQVLRDFGENSIVGSICPKILDNVDDPYFGYNPAVNAIVDRLAEKLSGTCLPRELSLEAEGVPCAVVEAKQGELDCSRAGREPVAAKVQPAVVALLADTGYCSEDTSQTGSSVPCSAWGMCTIVQAEAGSDAQRECFETTIAAGDQDPGYCYIDPAKGPAAGGTGAGCTDDPDTWGSCTNENVAKCPATQRRILRFVGPDTPINNSNLFVACVGEASSDSGGSLPPLPEPTP
jgi:hypothetical protein